MPFNEALHPRGFGGKFGHGTGTKKVAPKAAPKQPGYSAKDVTSGGALKGKPPAAGKPIGPDNAAKIRNAATMYGTGSKQHLAARAKFGPKPVPAKAAPKAAPPPPAPKPTPPAPKKSAPKPKPKPSKKVAAAAPASPKPFTFTDESYAAHAAMVHAKLNELRAKGEDSRTMYQNAEGEWNPERLAQHKEILQGILAGANGVPREGKAVFAGGLGGAGKGTILRGPADIQQLLGPDAIHGRGSGEEHFLTVNPDDIKEIMAEKGMIPRVEGLSPMESSPLVHEEASDLAKELAAQAAEQKINIIWDITMASDSSVQGRIDALREAGYKDIDGLFVDVDMPRSRERATTRHRGGEERHRNGVGLGGRYLPPEESAKNAPTPGSGFQSKNAEVFNRIRSQFGSTIVFDNNTPGDRFVSEVNGPRWADKKGDVRRTSG